MQTQEAMAKREREKGLRKGTALMVEKVQETSGGVISPKAAPAPAPSAFLEEGQGEVAGRGRSSSTRTEIKRQRVAAAREKRARL